MKTPKLKPTRLLNMHTPKSISYMVHNNHVIRVWATFVAIMYRLIPVIIFGLIFTQVAVYIDQTHYKNAPATDFLQYTDFTVQNARVNEDVYFKVCRTHVSTIRYDGNLNIYVIANPDQKNEQRIKVYGRDIAGAINTDCENKVIRSSDFKHQAGTYEMTFCVDFTVKYGYQKTVCKTSNRYRIYPQPADLQSQIMSLQHQLDAAQTELKATSGDINSPQDQSLDAGPQANANNPNVPSTPNQTPSNSPGSTVPTGSNSAPGGGTSGTGIQPPTCAVNIGGAGFACGTGGLLHL